jgi:hypothetical protein
MGQHQQNRITIVNKDIEAYYWHIDGHQRQHQNKPKSPPKTAGVCCHQVAPPT